MSFWGRLFGSDKATEKVIDNISNGIDKLWYTDEEKAEDLAKARSEGRAVLMEWMKNTQGQNLSRRLIALCITFVWLLMYLINVVMNVVAIWLSPETAQSILEASRIIKDSGQDLTSAVMLILAFYFAAPHMGKIAEGALVRFGQRNDRGDSLK